MLQLTKQGQMTPSTSDPGSTGNDYQKQLTMLVDLILFHLIILVEANS